VAEGVDADTGTIVKEETKQRRDCGDKKKYKDQNPDTLPDDDLEQSRRGRPKNKKLDADHIPSWGFVKNELEEILDVSKALMDCIQNEVKGNMESVVIPNDVHKAKSDKTAPNRKVVKEERAQYKQKKGHEKSLDQTAKDEAKVLEDEVDEKMEDSECKEKIKNALKEFKNLADDYFDNLIEEAEKVCRKKGIK
jgi:hypothetical protein